MRRSLFARIFLWFWLAIVLVGAAATVTSTWLHDRADKSGLIAQRIAEHVLEVQGSLAVELLEGSGIDALSEHLERWKRHSLSQAHLCDSDGQDVTGRPVSPAVAELVAVAIKNVRLEVRHVKNRIIMAGPVFDSAGHMFVFASELPPPGMLGRPPHAGPPGPRPPKPVAMFATDPIGLALVLGAVVITGGAVCYWLARSLTMPVERLRSATKAFGEGDLGARVDPSVTSRGDQIGELGREFDRMAQRVDELVAGQRRLLRDVSHELRSPLARVGVALGIARQRSDEATGEALDRIEREADRLNELIGQVLTLARLESGTEAISSDPVDLAGVVKEIVEDADFEAGGRECRVEMQQCDDVVIRGSAQLLHRAFDNVVRNAVLHTAPRTAVEVTLSRRESTDGTVGVLCVRDHGPGIPDAALEDVFEPFYRVDEARDRPGGGTGLGLAITRRAIEAHNGTVQARNAPDGGLVVEIELPVVNG